MGLADPNSTEPKEGESSQDVDRIKSLQSQVDGVKDIMSQNVDQILAHGERLEDLTGRSEDVLDGAKNFRHTSQKVARAYWWKNVKLIVVIVVIILVIVLIIIFLATGVIPTSSPAPKPSPP
ncbi:hypothetical protein Q8A67_003426 [Cirrhinus molitorella]|uniref:V-SNARE coiled-coil homology domain-containing protein n=1 Tax=Cirrhinus molitorella TaxID=172907 RepID=A0AA88Q549_9TELE|nr:hypothetical protein Q8A67_003426 [Cirrhinus molitorella]